MEHQKITDTCTGKGSKLALHKVVKQAKFRKVIQNMLFVPFFSKIWKWETYIHYTAHFSRTKNIAKFWEKSSKSIVFRTIPKLNNLFSRWWREEIHGPAAGYVSLGHWQGEQDVLLSLLWSPSEKHCCTTGCISWSISWLGRTFPHLYTSALPNHLPVVIIWYCTKEKLQDCKNM